jgi:hypothetical protein
MVGRQGMWNNASKRYNSHWINFRRPLMAYLAPCLGQVGLIKYCGGRKTNEQ